MQLAPIALGFGLGVLSCLAFAVPATLAACAVAWRFSKAVEVTGITIKINDTPETK